jgi:hypothetical protein
MLPGAYLPEYAYISWLRPKKIDNRKFCQKKFSNILAQDEISEIDYNDRISLLFSGEKKSVLGIQLGPGFTGICLI